MVLDEKFFLREKMSKQGKHFFFFFKLLPAGCPDHPMQIGSVWTQGYCLEPASPEIAMAWMLQQVWFSHWMGGDSQIIFVSINTLYNYCM